jgi:hypothetical protein
MKKLMMAAVALICMTMMSVSLTACGGDDDSPSKQKQQIEYLVTGNLIYGVPDQSKADPIPASWNGVFAGPMEDYKNIVQEIAPSPNYENRDVAIKNACEEIYNKHKALKGIEYTGTIKVQRTDSEEPVWERKY